MCSKSVKKEQLAHLREKIAVETWHFFLDLGYCDTNRESSHLRKDLKLNLNKTWPPSPPWPQGQWHPGVFRRHRLGCFSSNWLNLTIPQTCFIVDNQTKTGSDENTQHFCRRGGHQTLHIWVSFPWCLCKTIWRGHQEGRMCFRGGSWKLTTAEEPVWTLFIKYSSLECSCACNRDRLSQEST